LNKGAVGQYEGIRKDWAGLKGVGTCNVISNRRRRIVRRYVNYIM